MLSSIDSSSPEDIIGAVVDAMKTFTSGAKQSDDTTMIALTYRGTTNPVALNDRIQDCNQMHVSIYTTGGTIDKVYFDAKSDYQIGKAQITDILVEANVTLSYTVHNLLSKDSLELTDDDRVLIREHVQADSHSRILITHGTDTMAQTANALQPVTDKTIVLVGSLSPARFKNSDAVFNIGFAVGAVQLLQPGVYIAMNGRILMHLM